MNGEKLIRILNDEIDKRFEPEDRNSAFICAILLLQVTHGDYIAVTKYIVADNPLPTSSKRFPNLLRALADSLDRMAEETVSDAKKTVSDMLKNIAKEME
jgi:hypothetical protein